MGRRGAPLLRSFLGGAVPPNYRVRCSGAQARRSAHLRGACPGRGRRQSSSVWACPGRGLRQECNRCGRVRGVAKAQVHLYGAWLGWSLGQGWTRTSRDGTRGGARAGHAPPLGRRQALGAPARPTPDPPTRARD